MRLQAEGLSVEQIVDYLRLSKAGVKYYNQETYKKLGGTIRLLRLLRQETERLSEKLEG
ncbi:MAG: LuxR C-terminal-related transcriptional regulator [Clostridiales bacterium]|nr:LuxR C-terminal-related transcriptional regulator [Clostridiales bacterium]